VTKLPFIDMSSVRIAAMPLFSRDSQPNLDECTFATCDIHESWYQYRASLPANAAFTVVFAVSLLCFVTQGILSKRFIGFSIAMVCGTFGEVLGYVGRIMMYNNPWKWVRR
jgi:hypothetical protein